MHNHPALEKLANSACKQGGSQPVNIREEGLKSQMLVNGNICDIYLRFTTSNSRWQHDAYRINWYYSSSALAASPAADQLQTRQTLLPGYFFPTARLPRWLDQPIQSVSLAAIIHTEASVSSATQLGHCCSSFLCCCSETLELSFTELSNCSIR